MVVIYAAQYSPRLQYITSFIFTDLLNTPFQVTNDPEVFKASDAVKVYYDNNQTDLLNVIPGSNILFETTVTLQQVNIGKLDDFKTLFPTATNHANVFPFDIFAASFYLLSRYEEYLSNEKDKHGRYYYKQSLAFKEGFLQHPLINIWVRYFAVWLKEREPSFHYELSAFKFIPTYDVDIAYAYKGQGVVENLYHLSKSILTGKLVKAKQQLEVLKGNAGDPFDCFNDLTQLNKTYNLSGIFFLLTIFQGSKYDRNIAISKTITTQLFQELAASNVTGLHPSYQSGDTDKLLVKEKAMLEEIVQKPQANNRYHYLKFALPEGYKRLIDVGFSDDYSMGYGQVNGFRASTATPFFWYDLKKNEATILKVHPFCFMDSTSIFNLQQAPAVAFAELQVLYDSCKNVGGECVTIFHNHLMSYPYQAWKTAYEKFLKDNCS